MSCSNVAITRLLQSFTNTPLETFLRSYAWVIEDGFCLDIDELLRNSNNWELSNELIYIIACGLVDIGYPIQIKIIDQYGREQMAAGEYGPVHVIRHSGEVTGNRSAHVGHFEYVGKV
jgi:hypothetical protein